MTTQTERVSDERLASCPFCGESRFIRVERYQFPPDDEGPAWKWGYHVICDASGIGGTHRGCGGSSAWGETEAEATAAWNRRASPAPAESGEPVGYVTQAAIDLMLEAKPGSSGYHLIFSTPHAKSLPKQQSADVPIYGSPSTSGVGGREAVIEECIRVAVFAVRDSAVMFPSGPFMGERLPSREVVCKNVRDALRALSAAPSDTSRDTQPALLSTDETKEGGNG